jgi:hypothetical protein
MLWKLYDLKKSSENCPKDAYLLQPEYLHLTSYEVIANNVVKLNVGYTRKWSGSVSSHARMNYNQYIFGALYCEKIDSLKQVKFNKKGSIKISLFSKTKIINLPVENTHNVLIRCQNIIVKDIDIYVKEENGNFILDRIYREKLRDHLENNNPTFDNV